jgi:hypothetical protein
MVMKIVINSDFGGFGLSDEAMELYLTRKGIPFDKKPWKDKKFNEYIFVKPGTKDDLYLQWEMERDDPVLVQLVEELGEKADGRYAQLKIVEIPDGIEWVLQEYDGRESIHEKHRVWD